MRWVLAWIFGWGLLCLSGCGGGAEPGNEGVLDGPCYPNDSCNAGLVCESGTCVSEPSPGDQGEMNGPCYPNDTCNSGLICVEGLCASESTPDAGPTDTTTAHDATKPADVPSDGTAPDAQSCEGCFGEPCEGNGDCISGLCLLHMGGTVCSELCIDECPQGWNCRTVDTGSSDSLFACVSTASHLCLPCVNNGDCSSNEVQNLCLDYGEAGKFCGASCEEDVDCPESYLCTDIASAQGGLSKQCVHQDGVCSCSDYAIKMALATDCVKSNEYGSCDGIRTCTASGLAECDAATPMAEICNGLDDNCNESVDEEAPCADDNPCTIDACAEGACSYQTNEGAACDDGDIETKGDACDGTGTCAGTAYECTPQQCDVSSEPNGEVCTVEHQASGVSCDDANPTTKNDVCDGAGGCFGTGYACTPTECESTSVPDGTGCQVEHKPATSPCDDANPATKDDVCDASGVCAGIPYSTTGGTCDDSGDCTADHTCVGGTCLLDDGGLCSDDAQCSNTCVGGLCLPYAGTSDSCDDSVDCTAGHTCVDGVCLLDDGGVCTGDDQCLSTCIGGICQALSGTAGSCDDSVDCTAGHTCVGGACLLDDGGVCTGDDQCLSTCIGGICQPPSGTAGSCDDSVDCTAGHTCVGGACLLEDGGACTGNDQCVSTCIGGICQPPSGIDGTCDDSGDCTPGHACAGGTCLLDDGGLCTDDAQCVSTCIDGLCLPYGGTSDSCDDTADCAPGHSCVASACLLDDGGLCTDDAQCSNTCIGGLCLPYAGTSDSCDDSVDCTADHTCVAGTCLLDDGGLCSDDAQCSNTCVGGLCLPYAGTSDSCDDSVDCTAGHTCVDGVCLLDDGGTCASDGECVSTCIGGVCQPLSGTTGSCDDSVDCTVGHTCVDGACLLPTYEWVYQSERWFLSHCYLDGGIGTCDGSTVDTYGFSIDGGVTYYLFEGTCGSNGIPIPNATQVSLHKCVIQFN